MHTVLVPVVWHISLLLVSHVGVMVTVLATICCLYLIFKVLVRIVLDKTRDRPVALSLRLPQQMSNQHPEMS